MPGIDDLIGAGTQALGGIVKGIVGFGQKKKGNKLLNSLQYPTEQLPEEIKQNQILAQQQAATGLPSEQYANAMKNIQRQQLLAIRGAHDRRGGLGSIAGIQQGTNDAALNLDAKDAQMKIANQQNLINVNNSVGGWKSRLFDSNVRNKYNMDRSYAMDLIGSGNQNLFAGVDQVTGAAGQAASGLFGSGKSSQSQRAGIGYAGGLID